MKNDNFLYLIRRGIAAVWQNRLMNSATFFVTTVSLLLIGLSLTFVADLQIAFKTAESKNKIILFTERGLSTERLAEIYNQILESPFVEKDKLEYKSRDAALEELAGKYPTFEELFERLDEIDNPMPETYTVYLTDISKTSEKAEEFSEISGIEKVTAPYDYSNLMTGLNGTAAVIGGAVLIALAAVTVIIIYNSIRSSVHARRLEISIMRDFGATSFFIRTPFFTEGLLIGMGGGVASWLLTGYIYRQIINLLSNNESLRLAFGIAEFLPYSKIHFIVLFGNLIAGFILGFFGTALSLEKHLKF